MNLKDKIHNIRNEQVILDNDLAELYETETKYVNRAVKRNIQRFPKDFYFQLTNTEFENLRCHIGTAKIWHQKRFNPFVFTEHGVTALAGILKTPIAIEINIKIIRTFIEMRHFLNKNALIFKRLDKLELKQLNSDNQLNQIFQAIEQKQLPQYQGIFFEGQIYDAHKLIINLIKQAKNEIILIDNYIDESTLTTLSNKNKNVKITIYTQNITQQLVLSKDKFNKQYNNLEIIQFNKSHDRFLIIDNQTYHIGASIKDLGKKWFAFNKINNTDLIKKHLLT